ncbi:hypothetical protein HOE67_03675 [Candidatus Peregrinibacteria bacterium]|jgi:hypothetical protein|nr:hypothetical protein [Candidatus Peregrinibacteria bacterium]MBT4056185.1 hypothetical protein [Candidatus Peregrinibacteria bacterium]
MPKTLIKLVSVLITASVLLGTQIMVTANADDAPAVNNQRLEELTFPVREVLKLPGDQQSQNYFQEIPRKEDGTIDKEALAANPNITQFPVITFILDIINLLVRVAGTAAVLMLIVTGLVMMFTQGEQNIIEKAKQMFLYEIIGILVVFVSYVLVTIVQSIFTNV